MTVQVEGIGTMAGPPARSRILEVGIAELNAPSTVAMRVVEKRIVSIE